MAEGQDSTGGLTNESLATYAEWHAEQEQQAAQARQAAYDYRDAGLQYGGGRSLHAPDGRYAGVHYHYPRQAPARQRSRAQYGRRGASRGTSARLTSGGAWGGGWSRDASYAPRTQYKDCIAEGGWWRGFFGGLGELFVALFRG